MSPRRHPHAPSPDALDPVYQALADPTRRHLLDLLHAAPRTTSELADAVPQSRFAVMKHLAVLVAAGLVVARRHGRERWNHLNAAPLQALHDRWVHPRAGAWAPTAAEFVKHIEDTGATSTRHQEHPMEQTTDRTAAGVLDIALEFPISAPAARVWQALTDEPDRWWPRDFHVSTGEPRMRFEARLGGRLYEEDRDGGGAVWYTVIAIAPGRSIDLVGHLSPAYGGPATTLLRLELRPEGERTVLALTDALHGRIGDRTRDSLESGWRTLLDGGLRRYLEEAER